MTFYTLHERGFFAANERACAKADVDIEIEPAAQNIFSQQTVFARLLNCKLQPFDGYGIFGTHVNVAFGRAYGVARDSHCFEYAVRVAFENGPVHKRAGVAFVRVTANVFGRAFRHTRKPPFFARGEARAAPAAQAGLFNFVDNSVGSHFEKGAAERGIVARADCFVYAFSRDYAAVAERDAHLVFIKGYFRKGNDRAVALHRFGVEQSLYYFAALYKVFFRNRLCVFGRHLRIERAFGIYNHYGAERAQTETARFYD